MENKKLNNLIVSFKELGNHDNLTKAYKQVAKELKMREHSDSQWVKLPRTDIEEIHLNAFYKAATTYKKGKSNFRTYLTSCVNNFLRDEEKKLRRRVEEVQESAISNEEDEEFSIWDTIADPETTDELAIKKEQRQLLRHLYANTDEFAQKVIEKFMELGNVGATAKSLNSNADRVNRALARLGRQYDANRFGDPSDYFTA